MEQKPSIGRIVLFRIAGDTHPAIVLGVHSDALVDLHVFGEFFAKPVFCEVPAGVRPLDQTEAGEGEVAGGFWFWPPRVA